MTDNTYCQECQMPRNCLKCRQADEIERLRAEVAGMREALESISNIADRRAVYEMARTALAARKGEA